MGAWWSVVHLTGPPPQMAIYRNPASKFLTSAWNDKGEGINGFLCHFFSPVALIQGGGGSLTRGKLKVEGGGKWNHHRGGLDLVCVDC